MTEQAWLSLACSQTLSTFFYRDDRNRISHVHIAIQNIFFLALKAPVTTAADDKFATSFLILEKNKFGYYMRSVCQQTILMKYHALFVIFEKAARF